VPARRDGRALGSPLRILVEDGLGETAIDDAWAAVGDVFARVDTAMSGFRDDSELTRLNRAGRPVAGSSRLLITALIAADRAGRMTGGRFDARVLAHLERLGAPGLWRPGPTTDPVASPVAPRVVGRPDRILALNRWTGEVELRQPVDLGGIGKGLALRWAARAAARHLTGVGFLIDAGGDIVARGTIDGNPWSVAIEDPDGASEPVAACLLGDGDAIATSSVRIGRWRDPTGREVHHLIDPVTGEPGGSGLSAVTVAWPDPAWAEVWSKALFLEGAGGIAAVARRRGLAAWWVTDGGELSMTPAARQRTTWVRAEAHRRSA
jgi:FAD:protein FMN transferase